MPLSFRRLITSLPFILLIAACFYGVLLAIHWLLGDVYAYRVKHAVNQWQAHAALPAEADILDAHNNIDAALDWEPGNPEYLGLKAQVLYFQALAESQGGQLDRQLLKQVQEFHRQAVVQRPRWPYSWAGLLLMKAHLQEWDQEFHQVLLNTVMYGPWERSVHLMLAQVAGLSWSHLDTEQKRIFVEGIQRGLRWAPSEIRDILDAYQIRSRVCVYLARDDYLRLCR